MVYNKRVTELQYLRPEPSPSYYVKDLLYILDLDFLHLQNTEFLPYSCFRQWSSEENLAFSFSEIMSCLSPCMSYVDSLLNILTSLCHTRSLSF